MKVLHCIHSLDPEGGGPRDFIEQTAHLQKQYNYEMEVLSTDAKDAPYLKGFPAKVHAVGPGITPYGFSKQLVPWLRKNAARFDVIIINGLWQYSSFGTWLAIRNTDKTYFVFPHGMLDRWFAYKYPLKHFKKLIYWNLAENRVLKDAKAVLFTSAEEAKSARGSFTPYEMNEVVIGFSTGAPPPDDGRQKAAFAKALPDVVGKKYLLFLSRLHEKKGCDLLIAAFGKIAIEYPDLHLVIAGPCADSYELTLREQVGEFEEPIRARVHFTGMIQGDTKWGALRGADALVLPSHQENFARVVSEALSVGTPVLISNKVNIHMTITQMEAGIVAEDDVDGTVEMIETWLRMTPAEQKHMRDCAHKCFIAKFEDNKFFPRFMALLEGKDPKKTPPAAI